MDRTDRRLLLAIRFFILVGFAAASYLTYVKLAGIKPICAAGGCEVVLTSTWSEVFGVPVTIFGMAGYIAVFAATFVKGDTGKLAAAFFAVTGAVFSIWLQYQALGVLKHFCPWCMTSAVCMNVLAVLTITRVVRLPKIDFDADDTETAAA